MGCTYTLFPKFVQVLLLCMLVFNLAYKTGWNIGKMFLVFILFYFHYTLVWHSVIHCVSM